MNVVILFFICSLIQYHFLFFSFRRKTLLGSWIPGWSQFSMSGMGQAGVIISNDLYFSQERVVWVRTRKIFFDGWLYFLLKGSSELFTADIGENICRFLGATKANHFLFFWFFWYTGCPSKSIQTPIFCWWSRWGEIVSLGEWQLSFFLIFCKVSDVFFMRIFELQCSKYENARTAERSDNCAHPLNFKNYKLYKNMQFRILCWNVRYFLDVWYLLQFSVLGEKYDGVMPIAHLNLHSCGLHLSIFLWLAFKHSVSGAIVWSPSRLFQSGHSYDVADPSGEFHGVLFFRLFSSFLNELADLYLWQVAIAQ